MVIVDECLCLDNKIKLINGHVAITVRFLHKINYHPGSLGKTQIADIKLRFIGCQGRAFTIIILFIFSFFFPLQIRQRTLCNQKSRFLDLYRFKIILN